MDVADALYSEYGEQAGGGIRAVKQDPVFAGGNEFLKQNFPGLDYIIKATIERKPTGNQTMHKNEGHKR